MMSLRWEIHKSHNQEEIATCSANRNHLSPSPFEMGTRSEVEQHFACPGRTFFVTAVLYNANSARVEPSEIICNARSRPSPAPMARNTAKEGE